MTGLTSRYPSSYSPQVYLQEQPFPMLNGTLTLVRGDDQDVGITLTNPDGTPYNLSGCALLFTARQTVWSSPIMFQKNTTDHLAPESGLSQISFVTADTAHINDTKHFFDLKLITAITGITTLVSGPFYVVPSTTAENCH